MRVSVLLFASYADALGAGPHALELPAGATASDVVQALRQRPGSAALPPAPLVAVNQRWAAPATALTDGDEVALLPPVAGG
jgi:molybdopterin converting factor small subunit